MAQHHSPDSVSGTQPAAQTLENTSPLGRSASAAATLLGAAALALYHHDTQTGTLSLATQIGFDQSALPPSTRLPGSGLEGWVARERAPLALDGEHAAIAFDAPYLASFPSAVCAPLVVNERVVGVLLAAGAPDRIGAEFLGDHLDAVASLAATALDHALKPPRAHMLSMVSHELRAPLQTINGYLDLTLSGAVGSLTAQQADFLRRARVSSERLTGLVNDLLLLSRYDSGEFSLSLREADIATIVREAAEEMELAADDAGVTLSWVVADAVPTVVVDASRVIQVLHNLISNAIKFTAPGGTITVEATCNGSALRLCVRDTGVGIPPEYHDRIFDQFFQVGSRVAYERHQGQGLGLAIVKLIVTRHGGTIEVASTPGQGSEFTVRLPVGEVDRITTST